MTTVTTRQELIDALSAADLERWTKRSIYHDVTSGYTFGAANRDDLLTRKRKYALYTYTMPDVFTINIDGELLEAMVKNAQQRVRAVAKEKVLTRLYEHHKIEKSQRTSSRTLEWATSALTHWLSTGGLTTSPETQVLIEVMEEEIRWLKRRNDEADRRAANPLRVSKRLTLQAAPPAQLPPALYKAMKRVGFSYDTSTATWSAWESDEAQVIYDSLVEQGRLW